MPAYLYLPYKMTKRKTLTPYEITRVLEIYLEAYNRVKQAKLNGSWYHGTELKRRELETILGIPLLCLILGEE